MEEKVLVLSDIHGNVSALDAVLADCAGETFSGVVLLGDHIDYGTRSGAVLRKLEGLAAGGWKILADIWGNHEKLAVDRDLERLSTDRGRAMAAWTAKQLDGGAWRYIREKMNREGMQDFRMGGLRCLAVHGSLEDPYWKAIEPDNPRGDYRAYDMVFSGHSHASHAFTRFYPAEDPERRNRKAVWFINPGSVGQPRNQNPRAQYAVVTLPGKRIELRTAEYDIPAEQALYPAEIDAFYRTRLTHGV